MANTEMLDVLSTDHQAIIRFWSKVEKVENSCWIWRGATDPCGYGHIFYRYKTLKAHRVAYWLAGGCKMKTDAHILHSCDNPACVNPAHLFEGTHAENMTDKANKGRVKPMPGETNPASKLKAPDIPVILSLRRSGNTNRSIAERYGVSTNLISQITTGKAWKATQSL